MLRKIELVRLLKRWELYVALAKVALFSLDLLKN